MMLFRIFFILITYIISICATPLKETPLNSIDTKTQIEELKSQIIQKAQSYQGKGDPNFTIQKELEALVKQLTLVAPQSPIKDRLKLLYGTWKQVWGPYEYRKQDRSVNPDIETREIYQVISSKGYYYNVIPIYKDGDKSQVKIGLLRCEYELDSSPNILKMKFTEYPGVEGRPKDLPIWKLAEIAEAGKLENPISIVPKTVVQWFFGGGYLTEIYTDQDLRIFYNSDSIESKKAYLHVMTRVKS